MTPEQEIEIMLEIVQSMLGAAIEVLESGEELSDEIIDLMCLLVDHMSMRVEELQATPPPNTPPPPAAHGLARAPYPSSNVNSLAYDPENEELFVRFMGRHSPDSGSTYKYTGVPQRIAAMVAAGAEPPRTSGRNRYHAWREGVTPSHGASVRHLVSRFFPGERIRA